MTALPGVPETACFGRGGGAPYDHAVVGCGPGRMVTEARRRRRPALGVDVSPVSVRLLAARGLPVRDRTFVVLAPGTPR